MPLSGGGQAVPAAGHGGVLSEKHLVIVLRNAGPGIEYRVCGIGEYEYPADAWDCVVSNLALHYVEDLEEVFRKVHRSSTASKAKPLRNTPIRICVSVWWYFNTSQPRKWVSRFPGAKSN